MNGLKYIRTRCNLSLNELAGILGVTRQALSAWENGKKDIPKHRQEQLEDYFGIDKIYFGEISENEKTHLLEKAMFRYTDNGKETYRYKPQEGVTNLEQVRICFLGDRDISLDEEFILVQRRKQEVLNEVDDIIKWRPDAGSIQSQMQCINRGCDVYSMINKMMKKMRNMKMELKIPFFYELMNVWKAMLLAYNLIDKNEIQYVNKEEIYTVEDGQWIVQLSDLIKEHWEKEQKSVQEHYERVKRDIKREKEQEAGKVQKVLSIEEQIANAEDRYRRYIKENM